MKKPTASLAAALVAFGGCASQPAPMNHQPIKYQDYHPLFASAPALGGDEQIFADLSYYRLKERVDALEHSGDPGIAGEYKELKGRLQGMRPPTSLTQKDFEYFSTLEKLGQLEKWGDPHALRDPDGTPTYRHLRECFEALRGYQPTLPRGEWDRLSARYWMQELEKTGDPWIFTGPEGLLYPRLREKAEKP